MSRDGTRPLAGQMGQDNDPYGINARSDTERLDWLESQVSEPWSSLHDLLGKSVTSWPKNIKTLTLREAIDVASRRAGPCR